MDEEAGNVRQERDGSSGTREASPCQEPPAPAAGSCTHPVLNHKISENDREHCSDAECLCHMDEGQSACRLGEWQPIESAPRDGSFILGFAIGWIIPRMVKWIGCWCDFTKLDPRVNPTHWLPLPELPK